MTRNATFFYIIIALLSLTAVSAVNYPLGASSSCGTYGTCQEVIDYWISATWNDTVSNNFSTSQDIAVVRWYSSEGSAANTANLNNGGGDCPVLNQSNNQFCVVSDEQSNVLLSSSTGTNQTIYEALHNYTELIRTTDSGGLQCWKSYVNTTRSTYNATSLCVQNDSASDASLKILGAYGIACKKQLNGSFYNRTVDYCVDWKEQSDAIWNYEIVNTAEGYFLCNGYNNAAGTCPNSSDSFRPDYYELQFLMDQAEYTQNNTRINAIGDILLFYNRTLANKSSIPRGKTGHFNSSGHYVCDQLCTPQYMDNTDSWRTIPALSGLYLVHPERIPASLNTTIFTSWSNNYSVGNYYNANDVKPFEIYSQNGTIKQDEESYKTWGMWAVLAGAYNSSGSQDWADWIIDNKYDKNNKYFFGAAHMGAYYSQYPIRSLAAITGLLDPATYTTGDTSYCYQETANVSTGCGGLATGTYGVQPGFFYINYTKPSNATNASLWQIKHGTLATFNATIPLACWNGYSDKVMFRIESSVYTPPSTVSATITRCHNGTDWQEIGVSDAAIAAVSNSTAACEGNMYDGNYSSNCSYFYTIPAGAINDWDLCSSGGCASARIYEEGMYWALAAGASDPNNYTLTFYNESTDLQLTHNIYVELFSDTYSKNYTATNGTVTIGNLATDNYTIRYWRQSTVVREYYHELTGSSNNDLRLYLVDYSDSTYYIATIKDELAYPCIETRATALRYFVNYTGYRVVEMSTSDSNGNALFTLIPNVVNYKFIFSGACGDYTTSPQKIVNTNDVFTVSDEAYMESFMQGSDVTYTLYYVNATQTFVFTWADAGHLIEEGCLKIIRRSNGTTTELSDVCIAGASGSLIYTISENTNNSVYYAEPRMTTDTQFSTIFPDAISRSFIDSLATWGTTGLFVGLIVFLAFVLFSAGSATTLILASVGSVVLLVAVGVIAGAGYAVTTLVILGGILLYKMKN